MVKSFLVRLDPKLFQTLKKNALRLNKSMNSHCVSLLKGTDQGNNELLGLLKKTYQDQLMGVILFGSTARGSATASSDIDLLIVLDDSCPINSKSYRTWDQTLDSSPHFSKINAKISPHFAHLPQDTRNAGSLWLEVALEGKILSDETQHIEKILRRLREHIAEGLFVRRYSYGIPYWKKESLPKILFPDVSKPHILTSLAP